MNVSSGNEFFVLVCAGKNVFSSEALWDQNAKNCNFPFTLFFPQHVVKENVPEENAQMATLLFLFILHYKCLNMAVPVVLQTVCFSGMALPTYCMIW